ncbi:helix-turn-helix domain-containing protein [Nocardia otitidiscaviarum]|uniref:helix-turn-helix domain-containing protein n=1 Tax=Nocardia otitidiscaviarum TaxID=1823 RepID=UPI001895B1D6|nr:helix-turn-helix transcriptional regulator [Nocardia otitidiscaviarum]MBF6180864.1 helix-turn-helix domain-containing protein [Nocardia otitidiscaviarum]
MAGSTLPRRALGRLLRELRLRAKKSQLAAGLAIDMSPPSINRLEAGRPVKISTPQFHALLDLYEASAAERERVLGLLAEAKAAKGDPKGGWWRAYSDLVSSHFDHYMHLEQECNRLTTFQIVLVPGMLQTSAYRRSMLLTEDPDRSAVDVERRIELAARRQAKITEDSGFTMNVLLSESVLRHQVGGSAVMGEQLEHLADVGQLPNVSIRVVPHSVGSYLGLIAQSFILLEFPPLQQRGLVEPPIVFVELREGSLFLEETAVIERYRAAIADISRVALDETASRRLVLDLAKEM